MTCAVVWLGLQYSWSPVPKTRHVRLVVLMALCLLVIVALTAFWVHLLSGESLSLTLLVISDVRTPERGALYMLSSSYLSTFCGELPFGVVPLPDDRDRVCALGFRPLAGISVFSL